MTVSGEEKIVRLDIMRHYVKTSEDNSGIHINCGIPNRAFYLIAMEIAGYAWEKAGCIWYESI
jgi:Zn-dependent metalloprotease